MASARRLLQIDTDDEPLLSSLLWPGRLVAPILVGVVTWVTGLYVALILESPYWNDDLIDKNLRIMLKASHLSLSGFIWSQISAFVRIDARFDPGLLAWTYSLFDVFDNRTSYKLVVGLLLAMALAIAAFCVAVLARSWVPAVAFVLVASGTLQVRLWADGITSFAGVMTLTLALTLGALLILLVKPGRWWTVSAGALYLMALVTYETVFLFAPAMIAIIVLSRRDWRGAAIAVAVPAMLAFLVAISLRLFTTPHPVSEYTVRFAPGAMLSTFAKQMIAALPLSQWWLGHTVGLPPIAGTLIAMSAVLMGVPIFLALLCVAKRLSPPSNRAAALCGLLGVCLWVAPACLVAVTKRWQTSIPWGQGYIPVVYEYFGLALCLLSLWLFVSSRVRLRRAHTVRLWNVGVSLVFALLSTFTMAGNLSLMP